VPGLELVEVVAVAVAEEAFAGEEPPIYWPLH